MIKYGMKYMRGRRFKSGIHSKDSFVRWQQIFIR